MKEERGITYLLVIAKAFTILDLYLTLTMPLRGFTEANPVMRLVLMNLGMVVFLVVNAVLSLLLLGFLVWRSIEIINDIDLCENRSL